jgi:hypothetical protein
MTKEQKMTPLRTRMIEDMKLAGLSANTQEVYLQAVSALVKQYRKFDILPDPCKKGPTDSIISSAIELEGGTTKWRRANKEIWRRTA